VTWEWRDGLRSWMFPGFLAGAMQAASWLDLGQTGYLSVIAGVLSLISVMTIAVAFALGWRHGGLTGAVLCAMALMLWPDMLYFGPKTLNEVQGGNILVVAVGLGELVAGSAAPPRRGTYALIGGLLGLVICLRIQLVPALPLVSLWVCRARFRQCWLPLLAGSAVPILALGLLDWLTLGSPFQSVWKNFVVNLIDRRSEIYGVAPVWWYLTEIAHRWGGALLAVGVLFAYGAPRAKLAAATALIVLSSHSVIPHKEYSFVYAALLLVIIVAGIGAIALVSKMPVRRRGFAAGLAGAAWVWFAAMAALTDQLPQRFQIATPYLSAMTMVGRQTDACGVGLYRLDYYWGWVGGYTYLGARIPVYMIHTPAELQLATSAMNYVLTDAQGAAPATPVPGYKIAQCRDGVCVMRAARSCTPAPRYEINNVLRATGY
jgi:GPI mannosyltransferase 3